jgi:hypothetical protein
MISPSKMNAMRGVAAPASSPPSSGGENSAEHAQSESKPWGLINPLTTTLFLFVANILLAVAPAYAAARNPEANLSRLYVTLADFDGGWVGAAASSAFLAASAANRGSIPTLTLVDAATTSPGALRDGVIRGDSWAAVWIAPNATASYSAAIAAATEGTAVPYDPAVLRLAWCEARQLASLSVGPPLVGLLGGVATRLGITAMSRAATLNASALASVAQTAPALLAGAFAPAVDNVAPFNIPVVNAVLGAGVPILVIFGMQIAAHIVQVEPSLPQLRHPRARSLVTLAVVFVCVTIVSALGAMLACLLAGVQVAGGITWLALFALNTAHMLGHALFFVSLGLLGGEMLAALPLIILLNCAWSWRRR